MQRNSEKNERERDEDTYIINAVSQWHRRDILYLMDISFINELTIIIYDNAEPITRWLHAKPARAPSFNFKRINK